MARTEKTTVDYFPHFVNHGKTMFILENRYGNDGYAFWYKLLELLGSTSYHFIDCNNSATWEFLLAQTRLNDNIANSILDLLANLDAINKELWKKKIVWSQNFVDKIADVYQRRTIDVPIKQDVMDLCKQKYGWKDVSVNKKPQTKLNQTKLNQTKLNNIYIVVFKCWNEQKIMVHRKLTDKIKTKIQTILKDNSEEEILTSIKNYAFILHSPDYYFKYTWALEDFLPRGLRKFLDLEIARNNYRIDDGKIQSEEKFIAGEGTFR